MKDTKQQSEKIPGEIHRVVTRNATEEQYLQIRAERVGTTYQQDIFTYRVIDVIRDDLKRVIFVGTLASM